MEYSSFITIVQGWNMIVYEMVSESIDDIRTVDMYSMRRHFYVLYTT